MNLVDSSGWLEYFSDGVNAENFSAPLNEKETLLVPTISLYEVFEVVLRERDENSALQVIAIMQQCRIVELTPRIALQAAKISIDYKLPMADSIIFTTAQLFNATIWTQDVDFKDLPNVKYFSK